MQNVLIQTVVYVTLLGLGFGFKKAGIFRVEDSTFLKSAILYLTMPATAVNGMKALELQPSFLWCLLIGFVTCTVLTVVGLFTARHSSPSRRLLYLFSLNSFNVGNFAIPFLTGLLSDNGFAALCLFDIAVAIYLYGISYTLAGTITGQDGGFSLGRLVKKIFTSPITDAYLIMLVLAAVQIRLPAPLLRLAEVMSNANPFLAMLSIGILFELRLDRQSLAECLHFFALRYGTALVVALGVYFLVPLPADIRQAICVLLMAPVASIAPLLTKNAGGDGAQAAQVNSLSILTGIVMMVVMYTVTG